MKKFDLTFEKFKELLDYLVNNHYIKVDEKGEISEKPSDEILSPLSFFLISMNLKSEELEELEGLEGLKVLHCAVGQIVLNKSTHLS